MGVRVNFNEGVLRSEFEKMHRRFLEAAISSLTYLGESFVGKAREIGDYIDQTGNLRSSIGFVILYNGSVVKENFEQGPRGTDRATGLSTGRAFAREVAAGYPKGLVLIVVAGMEYAKAVENRGREVLTTSAAEIESMVQEAFERIRSKMKSF